MFTRHYEDAEDLKAAPSELFAFVDDHQRFSSHMNESSWMMAGAKMTTTLDEAKGQAVGSHIVMSGRILGLLLELDEVVTVHKPPNEKVWRTVGRPKLLVIGPYQMGVRIQPSAKGARLTVFIDYALPNGLVTYWLGRLFGGMYARWCVEQMLAGAVGHFAQPDRVAA
jgi:hypothetical protein